MNRSEFEKVMTERGWQKKFHGTQSDLYQKGHDVIEVTDIGVELWIEWEHICPRMPWWIVTVEDGILKINMEVEL